MKPEEQVATSAPEWRTASVLVLSLGSAAALIAGWQLFWFLCDDAYIAFRYVHNFVSGHGLVWNAAPFVPVEGYSSTLWVLLLSAVWALSGIEPPQSSNWLLLGFALGSLGLVIRLGLWLPLSERLSSIRLPLLGLVLVGTLSNRTFLAWTSSGLEQGMFTFLLLAWLSVAIADRPGRAGTFTLTSLAALLELTRPDGLLFVAITGLMAAIALGQRARASQVQLADLWPLLPLALPIAHVVWRLAYYGEFLPNTYYAKTVEPWPDAGIRYAASFALEYAYYLWIPLALAAGVRRWRQAHAPKPEARGAGRTQMGLRALPMVALVLHFAYYTFLIGGDIFEYRIYHHLVPILMLLLPWLIDQAGFRPSAALAIASIAIGLGLVLPWTHWAQTQRLLVLHEEGLPHYRIAPHFPEAIRAWPESFDEIQGWLIQRRGIGLRHQTHKLFTTQVQWQRFPTRAEGLEMSFDDHPVMLHRAVGYPGWVLPNVAIIDGLGLNDWVIARNPVRSPIRRMAHERSPPAGYVECFRPNVFADAGRVVVNERSSRLSDQDIRSCERRFAKALGKQRGAPPW